MHPGGRGYLIPKPDMPAVKKGKAICTGHTGGTGVERSAPRKLVSMENTKGIPFQLLTVIRMGNRYQRRGSFSQAFTVQIGNTVLGHNVVYMRPAGSHAGTWLKLCDNPRLALTGDRVERNDGLAALGERGTADKIDLPAYT